MTQIVRTSLVNMKFQTMTTQAWYHSSGVTYYGQGFLKISEKSEDT